MGVLLMSVLYGIYNVWCKTVRSTDGVQQGDRLDDEEKASTETKNDEKQTNNVTNLVLNCANEGGDAQIQILRQSGPAVDHFSSDNPGPFTGVNRADNSLQRLETSV